MAWCVFVQGLPEQVKRILCASTQMDDLAIDQWLACMQAIMKEKKMEESIVVAAVQTTWDETMIHVVPYHAIITTVPIILKRTAQDHRPEGGNP